MPIECSAVVCANVKRRPSRLFLKMSKLPCSRTEKQRAVSLKNKRATEIADVPARVDVEDVKLSQLIAKLPEGPDSLGARLDKEGSVRMWRLQR